MRALILLAAAAGLCLPGVGEASCSPLDTCSCNIRAAPLQFGVYNALSPLPADTSGNIQVSCSVGPGATSLSYEIQLSPGAGGDYSSRRLAGPGESALSYNLYVDVARTRIWGDGSGTTSSVTGGFGTLLPSRNAQNHPVYGRMPARQTNAAAGSYADSILVTVLY